MSWLEKRVHVDMTPKDLRMIADKMEKQFQEAQYGDDTAVYEWKIDNTTSVVFHWDQERINKMKP